MHAFLFGTRLDDDVDALFVCLGYNVDMSCGGTIHALAVGPDIVGSGRHLVKSGYLFQQIFLYLVHMDYLVFCQYFAVGCW